MKKVSKIIISVQKQNLKAYDDTGALLFDFSCSTAANGTGSLAGSNKTPLGQHEVCAVTGRELPKAAILKARAYTGKTAEIISEPKSSGIDCITSRIIRLKGLEAGKNQGKNSSGQNVDSYQRFIYIHGTNEEGLIGRPVSHGCIRLKNDDVIALAAAVDKGVNVIIEE